MENALDVVKKDIFKGIAKLTVGTLALLMCTNITCSGTYAVLKLVVNC